MFIYSFIYKVNRLKPQRGDSLATAKVEKTLLIPGSVILCKGAASIQWNLILTLKTNQKLRKKFNV